MEEKSPSTDEGAVEMGSPKTDPIADSIEKNGGRSDLQTHRQKPEINYSETLSKRAQVDGVVVLTEMAAPR